MACRKSMPIELGDRHGEDCEIIVLRQRHRVRRIVAVGLRGRPPVVAAVPISHPTGAPADTSELHFRRLARILLTGRRRRRDRRIANRELFHRRTGRKIDNQINWLASNVVAVTVKTMLLAVTFGKSRPKSQVTRCVPRATTGSVTNDFAA